MRGSRSSGALREVAGIAVAAAVAIAVVAAVSSTDRSALLYRDGDSLVTSLIVRSILAGQPQDWAMSSVLFLPETALVAVLTPLGLGVAGTLGVAAVLTLLAVYGALRFAAGSIGSAAPVAGGLLAFGAFAALAATGTSATRESLELASLSLTTTYYSATVVASIAAFGLAARMLRPAAGRAPFVGAAAVAAASVLTNPLFAVWAAAPIVVVLGVVGIVARGRAPAWGIAAVVGGSAAGFLARIPLAPFIEKTGATYLRPDRWRDALTMYSGLTAERWQQPWGAFAVLLVAVLLAWCAVATVLLARRRDVRGTVLAATGWVAPLGVVVGAIALGTDAARYLQPLAFAPVLGLAVLPRLVRMPAGAALRRAGAAGVAAAASALLVVSAAIGAPRIAAAANAPDPDLACVVAWVDASGRTGAGQFWTVRLPKAHVADPRTLVQVDDRLNGYSWLVDRDDFGVGVGGVSFLVIDAASAPFRLPEGVRLADAETVSCGRYTIADFGERTLPIGSLRS